MIRCWRLLVLRRRCLPDAREMTNSWTNASSWAAQGPNCNGSGSRRCLYQIDCGAVSFCVYATDENVCVCMWCANAGAMVTIRSEQTPLRSSDTAAALTRWRRRRRWNDVGSGAPPARAARDRLHTHTRTRVQTTTNPDAPTARRVLPSAPIFTDLSIDLRRLRDRPRSAHIQGAPQPSIAYRWGWGISPYAPIYIYSIYVILIHINICVYSFLSPPAPRPVLLLFIIIFVFLF